MSSRAVDELIQRRIQQAREFALDEDDPLRLQAIEELELAEPEAIIHLLPVMLAHRKVEAFVREEGIGVVYIPKVHLILSEKGVAALVEQVDLLSLEESAERYLALSKSELDQLVRLWARARTLQLEPRFVRCTADGRLFLSLEQMRCRRLGELSLSLLPAVDPAYREWLLERWADELRQLERAGRPRPFDPDVERYVLPPDHPVREGLRELFVNPADYVDRGTMVAIGYQFEEGVAGGHLDRIYVAGHQLIKRYLVKCYALLGDPLDHDRNRLRNYLKRVRGAEAVRRYAAAHRCENLVVPMKWLYRLPSQFETAATPNGRYILIAERLDLAPEEESRDRWWNVRVEVVEELFRMLAATGLGDLAIHNLPWTRDEQIALIDTETYGASRGVRDILSAVRPEIQDEVAALWQRLS